MTNIIKYNDFVQINPDKRILSLDKSEKIKITDNMINRAYTGGKGLVITYDLSHSGRRINNRIYSTAGQQRGIDSLTQPYAKPILKNHDQGSEPIGRFIGGEWQNLYDEATDFLQSNQAALDVHNAFASDEPGRIYKTLKTFNLIDNKKWPGLGRMRVQANITDEDAIKKFMDGRYLTFSAGSTTNRHVCSICENDWSTDGMCEHRHGQQYDGETCVFITGDFIVLEGSVVNTPADDLSQLVNMEFADSTPDIENKDYFKSIEEIILTDSIINIGEENEAQRIQETKQIDAEKENYKEEETGKEKVEKKYDHEMSISDKAMMELHEKGETYITQKGDGETMIIKVKYSGSMKKDSLDLELIENELNLLVEELNDEKTFKVPSGAKGNAQKVLDWKKKYGSEVKGMTPVGWARARQLATKSEIGLSTVKRMAAFARHRKNAAVAPEYKSTPWKDRGYVAWLGWGGTSGVDWAIKISAANDSEASEDAYRSSPKGKGAKTPAKPSERIKGSKKNKEGSASKANSKISVGAVLDNLKEKVRKHNGKHGKTKGKRVSLGMLKAVYRRGAGAFSSTHRPGMSRSGWGVARVNAFLKLVRSGRPSNPKYVQDNDLLPSGHPRKSSNKSNKAKDFSMSEKITTEEEILAEETTVDSEETIEEDADLLEEVVEPTEEEQAVHDESFDCTEEVSLQDEEIDWEILDLALQASMEDAQLSTEQRKELPDSAFCGPDRSFPVPDCAHVTAARRLIGRAKVSGSVKQKIMGCVNSKAAKMKCERSEDMIALEEELLSLKAQYADLEEKFKLVLEKVAKNEDSDTKAENNDAKVENPVEDSLNSNEEVVLTDTTVDNPSVHTEDKEDKMSSKIKSLGSFEQKIVKDYKQILADQGEIAAAQYFASKASYLPRGFNPNNF
jgi:hypothetical protein